MKSFVKICATTVCFALFFGASLFLAQSAQAAPNYPKRAVNVIIPYLPGGYVELCARPYLEAMSKELGVPVMVTLTPGAGASIGITKALRAKPDGYTLVLTSDLSFALHPQTRTVKYEMKDSNPVYGVLRNTGIWISRKADARFSGFEEMLDYCKENPGKLTVGISGLNSLWSMQLREIEDTLGCKLQQVPFDGGLAVSNAVVSGHVDLGMTEYLKNSEQKPILFYTSKTPTFPELKDFADLGYAYMPKDSGMVLYGHPDMPEDIRQILASAAQKAMSDPTFLSTLEVFGHTPYPATKEEILTKQQDYAELIAEMIKLGVIIPNK